MVKLGGLVMARRAGAALRALRMVRAASDSPGAPVHLKARVW